MSKKWESIEVVFTQPLSVVFCYGAGVNKAGSLEVLTTSEWDIIALDEGRKLPNGREPFFTKEEVVAAKRAIAERGIRIA